MSGWHVEAGRIWEEGDNPEPIAYLGEGMEAHGPLIAAAPEMKAALNALVVNYAQTGRVTDEFVQQVARMMEGLD